MPTFPTPHPVHIVLGIGAGDIHVRTAERADTTVEVAPRDPTRSGDVRAAEQTHVELSGDRLVVRTPRNGIGFGRGGIVDVTIDAPAGSRLDGHTGAGYLESDGPLGDVSFRSGAGDIRIAHVGGVLRVTTGSGAVRVGGIERAATIKSGNGGTEIGAVDGDVRVTAANGDITIEHAGGSVVAKTANGDVRVREAARGSLELSSAKGNIDIGIAEGTAAKLDVRTSFGRVDQQLQPSDGPASGGDTLSVKGRTSFGDITIARAIAG